MEVSSWVTLLSVMLVFVLVSVRAAPGCDDTNCRASNGEMCNGKGECKCGVCTCAEGHWGPTCEECRTCPTPCSVFKGCVGCKIFGTGPIGVIECLSQCDYIANYLPVEKEEFDTTEDERILCSFFNEGMCMESFKVGGMTQGYRDLYVRTEMNCSVPIPTTTTTLSVINIGTIDDSDDKNVSEKGDENHGMGYKNAASEDAAAASGHGGSSGSAPAHKTSVISVCVLVAVSFLK
ncbi:ITB3-like protein [Mya arenaria]|uniref:ITB3-like protein n=1 Tax=Mya arenaria TaxID=6604 RepID=A0ABY7ESY3_MYAAR|nr:ITB3-like protein [Mya arenaria]